MVKIHWRDQTAEILHQRIRDSVRQPMGLFGVTYVEKHTPAPLLSRNIEDFIGVSLYVRSVGVSYPRNPI